MSESGACLGCGAQCGRCHTIKRIMDEGPAPFMRTQATNARGGTVELLKEFAASRRHGYGGSTALWRRNLARATTPLSPQTMSLDHVTGSARSAELL
jgi:hypothetical protein